MWLAAVVAFTEKRAVMKNILIFLLLSLMLSCSRHRRSSDAFPNLPTSDVEWITYEGILPTAHGEEVLIELHLMPGSPGLDSYYRMTETLYDPSHKYNIAMGSNFQGKYAVLLSAPGVHIVQITSRDMISSLMRDALLPDHHVDKDLYLKSTDDEQLILTDESFQESSSMYVLNRRSELFTVEGYLTVYPDTTEYFERNTRKKWSLARFGCYDEATNNYHSLAMEKHQGMYLKALSYSILRVDKNGNEYDALVFKDILLMDSAYVK